MRVDVFDDDGVRVYTDPQPHWIETLHEDYRPVAGVLYPFRQVDRRLDTG